MDANKDNVIQLEEFIAYLPEDVKDASDPFLFFAFTASRSKTGRKGRALSGWRSFTWPV